MNFEDIRYYKNNNTTLKILSKETLPFVAGFLYGVFKNDNRSVIQHKDITVKLTDYIYYLNQNYSDESYPLSPESYLTQWADDGILRKYYGESGDEPLYEMTPAMEKAIEWIDDLKERDFVGTESRMIKIFDLLREIVYKSSSDPKVRLKELHEEKLKLQAEIDKIDAGVIETLDNTQIKERFFELTDTARRLIGDFRQVEYNFRDLDRMIRVKLSDVSVAKGDVVDNFFNMQGSIWETDQGRSFRSFWELLLSQTRLDELDYLIRQLIEMDEVKGLSDDTFIRRLKYSLTESGSKVNKTIFILIEQLARFIDERAIDSNRRVLDIIKEIESRAIKLTKNQNLANERKFVQINDKPEIESVVSRLFYRVPEKVVFNIKEIASEVEDFDAAFVYGQIFVDKGELIANIEKALTQKEQIALGELINSYPVKKGLLELIEY